MNDNGDWLRQMTDLQQQYLRSWQGIAGSSFAPPPPRTPWQDGIDAWQRMFAGPSAMTSAGGAGADDVGARLLAFGRQYVDMLQQMASQAMSSGGGFDPRAWLMQMRNLHEQFGQGMASAGAPAMPWFGGIDAGQVEQLVKLFTAAPTQRFGQAVRSLFDLPAFGLGREHQERAQALAQGWIDYQGANSRYNELMLKTVTRTLDVLEGKLGEREQPGRQIESARALYDVWIDAAEEAFAGVAMSPEYRAVYGDLVNSQMRVRAGINAEVERIAAQFGLPTRTEVDSMARQLHELRRALRQRGAGTRPAGGGGTQRDNKTSKVAAGAARPATRSGRKPPSPNVERARPAAEARGKTTVTRATQATEGRDATRARSRSTASASKAASRSRPATVAKVSARSDAAAKPAAASARKATSPGKRGDDAPMIQSTARKNAGAR